MRSPVQDVLLPENSNVFALACLSRVTLENVKVKPTEMGKASEFQTEMKNNPSWKKNKKLLDCLLNSKIDWFLISPSPPFIFKWACG